MNKFFRFSGFLLAMLTALFFLHAFAQTKLGHDWRANLLLESYLTNCALVIFTYGILWLLKERFASSLGFLFLGGFFVKLAVFFIFFQPIYKADQQIETAEFLAFFIPYALCLILETKSLVGHLNQA